MMRIRLRIFSVLTAVLSAVVVIFFAGYGSIFSGSNKIAPAPQIYYSGTSLEIRGIDIPVEIAKSAEQRQKGLSGRPSLDQGKGMLFIFNEPGNYAFWMPDMHFPIDIIWIDEGYVVGVTPNVTHEAGGEPLPSYYPPKPVRYVLEVNAGFAEKHGITAGDEVVFKNIE